MQIILYFFQLEHLPGGEFLGPVQAHGCSWQPVLYFFQGYSASKTKRTEPACSIIRSKSREPSGTVDHVYNSRFAVTLLPHWPDVGALYGWLGRGQPKYATVVNSLR